MRPEIGDTALGLAEMTCRLVLLQGSEKKGSRLEADRFMYLLEGGSERQPRLRGKGRGTVVGRMVSIFIRGNKC